MLVMAVVAIGGGIYSLYQRNPKTAPVIFAASMAGLLARAYQLSSEKAKDAKKGGRISFETLRQVELAPYASWLKENVRGHDAVVDSIVKRIQQSLRLSSPNRTLGAFLLVGPTGTGKTFLAELVAKALYPESELVNLRMNQYKMPEDVMTLLGPPPGQVGYEVGGTLTRPVLEDPYRVIILDEIDKCHPDIRDCLYNVLDTAECREKSSGKSVQFNACAIFATCNAGVASLRQIAAQVSDPVLRLGRMRDALQSAAGFDKAFLARFDEIFLMDELRPVNVAEVACLQLAKFWRGYGIEVTWASPELIVEAVGKNQEFSDYGVRQLAHLVHNITEPMIEQAKRQGATKVKLDRDPKSGEFKVVVLEKA